MTISGSSPAYTVACATCACGWCSANVTLTGQSLAIAFSSGVKDTGSVNADFSLITWADESTWDRPTPPPPPAHHHVHLCPHAHLDPGWFQTVDDLYDTLFKGIVEDVLASLLASPARTFAAEHAIIFAMYYEGANASTRETMRALVARGALEFTGGGWVQPDEAITRHEDLIDQLTLGHAFITQTLGHAPVSTTWIADPFGHSTSSAAMHAAASSDLLIIGRTMSPLDPFTLQSGTVWHPTASLPSPGAFTPGASILAQEYGVYCSPYRDMKQNMVKGDVKASVVQLLAFVAAAIAAPPYRTEHLVMFGDDGPNEAPFPQMYLAIDALVDAVNALSATTNITVSYSSPSRYAAALAQSVQSGAVPAYTQPYPTRPAWDMLPLVGNEFPYWVG